jgi:hypothetical protein
VLATEVCNTGAVRARILRVAGLHDAETLTAAAWADTSPLERLAAVEAIRRATFTLDATRVRRMARVIEVADAPCRTNRRRAPRCRGA